MYGDWQVGAVSAEEYVRTATRWARAIKMLDPQAELISCGMNGWNDWDRVVIDGMAPLVDYHSLHIYTGSDDYWTNVLQPHQAERAIRVTRALIERAAYVKKITNPPRIAYDEWNVWYREPGGALEERYNFPDALAVATYLNIFVRNCAWVRMANLAQMVNAIAPIVTSPETLAAQPIYYPVLLHAKAALDLAVDVHVSAPTISPLDEERHSRWPHRVADLGPFTMVDAAATASTDRGKLALTLVNRNPDEPETVEIVLRDLAFDGDAQIATVTAERGPAARVLPDVEGAWLEEGSETPKGPSAHPHAPAPVVHRDRGGDDRRRVDLPQETPTRKGQRLTMRSFAKVPFPSRHSWPRPPGPRRTAGRAAAGLAAAAAVSLLAACGSSGGSTSSSSTKSAAPAASGGATLEAGASCKSSSATKITFWAWVPGMGRAVTEFNKTHPTICVTQEDVGAGDPEYVKITDALKAGSGAPDVAEVEFDELPSFEVTHNVVNLVPYGANKYKSDFVPWAWQEVSQGSAVYAMPGDSGPMAFYYNSKLLAKYHITPPTTWAQFAADAAKLNKADPSAYMTNFSATDLQWVMSLMAQDNAWPFAYTGGSKVTINWTGPAQMKFAAYWQKLLNAHEVNGTTDVSATVVRRHGQGHRRELAQLGVGPVLLRARRQVSRSATGAPRRCRSGPRAPTWPPTGAARPTRCSPEQAPGRGGRVRRVAERDHRVVEHHQDGRRRRCSRPTCRCSTTRRTRTPPSRCPGRSHPDQVFSAAASSIKGVPVAAVHDRGADPVRHRLRRRADRQGDAAAGVQELPECPGELRQAAGIHGLQLTAGRRGARPPPAGRPPRPRTPTGHAAPDRRTPS